MKRANQIAKIINNSNEIHIVTHIDADGITAGAIASKTLNRIGKQYSIEFVKQIDRILLKRLKSIRFLLYKL